MLGESGVRGGEASGRLAEEGSLRFEGGFVSGETGTEVEKEGGWDECRGDRSGGFCREGKVREG